MIKIIKQKRKSIVITIDDDLNVVIKAPYGVSKKQVNQLVDEKCQWIEEALKIKKQRIEAKDWLTKRQISILGKTYQIIIKNEQVEDTTVRILDKEVIVASGLQEEQAIKAAIEKQLKTYFLPILQELSEKYCSLLGCNYNKISLRKQKTRWGSCSSKGNLSYNIKLIGAPIEVIEYVVLHEVMHLKHFNHSKTFWVAIETVMPDYKQYEVYLKEYGKDLEI